MSSTASLQAKSSFDLNGNNELPHQTYRASPLPTSKIAIIVVFLSIYSAIYLTFAQKHAALFYVMTGLIVTYLAFIYTAGIFTVLYMVQHTYPSMEETDKDCNEMKEFSA